MLLVVLLNIKINFFCHVHMVMSNCTGHGKRVIIGKDFSTRSVKSAVLALIPTMIRVIQVHF